MIDTSFKSLFSRALTLHPGELWFTTHSHGLRPDAYAVGQDRCTQDTLTLADKKWGKVFREVLPEAERIVATFLGSKRPSDITFGTNTHELVMRVFSNYWGQPLKILTTDSEFYSQECRHRRLSELPHTTVTEIPVEPFDTFPERFLEEARGGLYDLAFFSHVFFNSAHVVRNLTDLVRGLHTCVGRVVIDGYHAVGAFPFEATAATMLDAVYYVGGCYKYLQAGEGAGFLSLPADCRDRPVDTGWTWMAGTDYFEQGIPQPLPYGRGSYRYLGATFDPSALYRLNAIWEVFSRGGIDAARMQEHVAHLQDRFLDELDQEGVTLINRTHLVHDLQTPRAMFLCFELPNATQITSALEKRRIFVDHRNNRLRIGFGLYHDENDISILVRTIRNLEVYVNATQECPV